MKKTNNNVPVSWDILGQIPSFSHHLWVIITWFNILEAEYDIELDGYQLTWQYLKSEIYNDSKFRYWPSDILSQFPMKGINLFLKSSKNISDLNLLRASLVYMIRLSDSSNDGFDLQEWQWTYHEGPYLTWTNIHARLYSRLMLPGKYKIHDQAIYLFASSGKISWLNLDYNFYVNLV